MNNVNNAIVASMGLAVNLRRGQLFGVLWVAPVGRDKGLWRLVNGTGRALIRPIVRLFPMRVRLDDFYEKCTENASSAWSETARTIIEDWLERPGSDEFHGNVRQVSLYYASPRGGTNVLSLDIYGSMRVCRGYIWESSGVFDPEVQPTELDQNIRAAFPDAVWAGRQYYIRVPEPDPAPVAEFADWLTARFEAASS